jgi:hypothetical protein
MFGGAMRRQTSTPNNFRIDTKQVLLKKPNSLRPTWTKKVFYTESSIKENTDE